MRNWNKLKQKDLLSYNLDVWGYFVRKNKFNESSKEFLYNFEINFRQYYYNNFIKLYKRLNWYKNYKKSKRLNKIGKFNFKELQKKLHPIDEFTKIKQEFDYRHRDYTLTELIKLQNKSFYYPPKTPIEYKFRATQVSVLKNILRKKDNFWLMFNYRFLQMRYRKEKDPVDDIGLTTIVNRFKPVVDKSFSINGDQQLNLVSWKHLMQTRNCFFLNKKFVFLKKFRQRRKSFYSSKNNFFLNKKSIPGWILSDLDQKRFLYFYGFFTLKKFKSFLRRHNISLKNPLNIMLELSLINFLFKLGFFLTTLEIYRLIKSGHILVNNKVVFNPHFLLKIFDNVSFKKVLKIKLFNRYRLWLKNKKIFLNIPPYVECNLYIFIFSIWRLPKPSEVSFNYQFPFYSKS